jgi:hypothetical protein
MFICCCFLFVKCRSHFYSCSSRSISFDRLDSTVNRDIAMDFVYLIANHMQDTRIVNTGEPYDCHEHVQIVFVNVMQ